MRIEDYEMNKRRQLLESDRKRDEIVWTTIGYLKEKYYDGKQTDILACLIQRQLNDLYVMGLLKHEVKVSAGFVKRDSEPEFKLEIKLLR